MDMLDSLIRWVSPGTALRRALARENLRAFEGAKHGRKTAGWLTSGKSGNAEILPDLTTLRNRASDLVRNNPWAKKAIGNWVDDAIGTGIRLATKADDRAAKHWLTWAEGQYQDANGQTVPQCDADGLSDFYGLQALAARTMWERGAVIIRRRWRTPKDGLVVPLQLQVLEPDFLDHHKSEETRTGYILGGIQYNKFGQREGYWLFDQHPGEALRQGLIAQSRFVEAREVIYAFKRTRAGQVHGVPELAAVLLRLRDLDDYEDAEITRKKIEACFSVFITGDDTASSSVGAVEKGKLGRVIERIAPGLIQRLKTGEDVKFAQPTATAGYPDFVRQGLRAIAAGVNQTYEQVSGDLSQVNYSSFRAGRLAYQRSVEAWQWLTFIPMVCQRVLAWYNEAAALAGKPMLPANSEWTTPRVELIDPVRDVKGELLQLAAGLSSHSEALRRRGLQPEKVLAELKADWERLREAGIPLSFDGLVALATAPEDVPDDKSTPEEGKSNE